MIKSKWSRFYTAIFSASMLCFATITQAAQPEGAKKSSFADFAGLVNAPAACSSVRQAGRPQWFSVTRFAGRNSGVFENPVCGPIRECLSQSSSQVRALIDYLRNRPLTANEYKKHFPPITLAMYPPPNFAVKFTDLQQLIEAANNYQRASCDKVYGLLPFYNNLSAVAEKMSRALQAEYLKDVDKFDKWTSELAVYAKQYARVDQLAQLRQLYQAAYNSDIETFLRLKQDFGREIAAAFSFKNEFDDLERKRQGGISSATEALSTLSNPAIKTRLNKEGIAIVERLDASRQQLMTRADLPFVQRRDFSASLQVVQTVTMQVADISSTFSAIEQLSRALQGLQEKIDRSGRRRFLPPDSLAQINGLFVLLEPIREVLESDESDVIH